MHFEPNHTYHVYNRGNEPVFFKRDNYLYFLKKVNTLFPQFVDILAWCLMPNHFHFLVVAKPIGCEYIKEKHRPNTQNFSKNIGTLLSSYTRAINKQEHRRGNLFVHNTEAKCLNEAKHNDNFLENCFHYIHQNPLRAKLCKRLRDWEFSSFRDYAGLRDGKLINKELACDMLNLDMDDFEMQSEAIVATSKVFKMF